MPSQTQLQISVTYDAPVFDCRRVLRILPLLRPNQKIIQEHWHITPEPTLQIEKPDEFGNRRLFIHHSKIAHKFELGLELEVETINRPLEKLASETLGLWRMPSRAVDFSSEIVALGTRGSNLIASEPRSIVVRFLLSKFGLYLPNFECATSSQRDFSP